MQRDTKERILNSEVKDSGAKLIFSDNALCAQFLKDYVDIPCLKDIKPEDIEDVSEQFVHLFEQERNADRVKRVNLKSKIPFFLISLIEHKTKVDYNVSMQIFRYMVYIWDSYTREAERLHKGISRRKDFRYPPILPIVYYEGKRIWSAPRNFRDRIQNGRQFGKYIPDFRYYLVPLHDYSNEALLENGDAISLVMLLNKLQSGKDIEAFRELPAEKMSEILREVPEHQTGLMGDILQAFLMKLNVPAEEMQELVGKVREKKMAELFESMEKMDIQKERRRTKRAVEALRRAEERAKRGMQSLVEAYQSLGGTKEDAIQKIMESYELPREEAAQKVEDYWKK